MLAGLAGTASAQTVTVAPPNFLTTDFNECYYTAVSNGEDFGLGESQTSITVQNIDDENGFIFIWRGNGNGWTFVTYAQLNWGGSKTFTGADLGIPAGTVAPVVVAQYDNVSNAGAAYHDFDPLALACVAKQAVEGNNLPNTSAADTSVSGYNAVSGREVGFADELYLPIAQTNCGPGGCWNSIIRVANVGFFANAAVTVRFFPATEYAAGSLQAGFQLHALVNIGEVWSIDMASLLLPGEEWVGSVHIYSDDEIVGMVDRYKAGTDMWITNTANNAQAESEFQHGWPYALYAPDVRTDYNGWNTGISVANTVDWDTDISIQYVGTGGNAPTTKSARLSAHGMTFFYDPSSPSEDRCQQPATQVPGCEFLGAALILSTEPVAAVIDGVKYFGNDQNVGQAFSYSATGNAYDVLAAPLVQKGNATTGFGATSGINFLNTNDGSTDVVTVWINPSGFLATNFIPSLTRVPGNATGFVYTMWVGNLPAGFVGSALVFSDLPISATTANVDYAVDGDGTTVWNLYNPCGLFRQAGECVFTPPIVDNPLSGLIVKTVTSPTEGLQFVPGAVIRIQGTTAAGVAFDNTYLTNAAGQINALVPAGTYTVTIVSVPPGFTIDPDTAVDTVTIVAGQTVQLDNPIDEATGRKIIDTAKPGALICVFGPGGTAQDPKAPAVPGDCFQGFVLDKDVETPGQGGADEQLATTFARGGATVVVNNTTNSLNLNVVLSGLSAGRNVTVEINTAEVCGSANVDTIVTAINPATGGFIAGSANGAGVLNVSFSRTYATDPAVDAGDLIVVRDAVTRAIIACGMLEEGTLRLQTPAEIAAARGAVAVQFANAEGDAIFDLPAGCYVAVIVVPGHEIHHEFFCVTPGSEETNTIQIHIAEDVVIPLPPVGKIVKTFVPGLPGGVIEDLEVRLFVGFGVDPSTALDYDSFTGDEIDAFDDGTFALAVDVPAGNYTLCYTATLDGNAVASCDDFVVVTGGGTTTLVNIVAPEGEGQLVKIFRGGEGVEFDLEDLDDVSLFLGANVDPSAPNGATDLLPGDDSALLDEVDGDVVLTVFSLDAGVYTLCFEATIGEQETLEVCENIIVAAGEPTVVLNIIEEEDIPELPGSLDVYVETSDGSGAGMMVCVLDVDLVLVAPCELADVTGYAHFEVVPGAYFVTVVDPTLPTPVFQGEIQGINYTIAGDLLDTFLVDTAVTFTWDLAFTLDPILGPVPPAP